MQTLDDVRGDIRTLLTDRAQQETLDKLIEEARRTAKVLAFFRAIQKSRTRALLIGRRALVLLGLPVLTADYDYWLAMADVLVARSVATVDGRQVEFDALWSRRRPIGLRDMDGPT